MKKFMTILAFLFIVLSWKSVSYGAEGNVWGAIDQDSEEFQQIYGKPYVTQEAIEILEKVNNPLAPGELGGSMASGDGDNAYAKKPSAQIIRIVCIIVGLVACVLCVRVFIRRKRK